MAQSRGQKETVEDRRQVQTIPPPVEQVEGDGVVAPPVAELKQADAVSGPTVVDAEVEDYPVRTGRPDQPVAVTIASGAGAHTPPDPEVYDVDGRPLDLPSKAPQAAVASSDPQGVKDAAGGEKPAR